MIGFPRNSFTLHVHVSTPAPRFTQRFFKFRANSLFNSAFTRFLPIASGKNHVPTQQVGVLFMYVSEIWNDAFGRLCDLIIFISEPLDLSAHAGPVIMMTNKFPKQAVIISQSIWKAV